MTTTRTSTGPARSSTGTGPVRRALLPQQRSGGAGARPPGAGGLPGLEDLDRRSRAALAAAGARRAVPAGTLLAREGRPAQEALVLVSGLVRADLRGVPLGGASPGELLGDLAALLRGGSAVSWRALTAAEVLAVPLPALRRLLDRVPALALALQPGS